MKSPRIFQQCWLIASVLLALLTVNSHLAIAQAQGTAFTYQGRLNNGTNPVTGGYDLTFSLYTANAGGTQIGGPVTNLAVGVTNGIFTTSINFGAVFTGSPAWLAIGVRTNGATTFSSLTPLQQLTPTPYAITAENLDGPVPSADLSGTYGSAVDLSNGANSFSGSGSGLTGLNASALATGTVPDARLAADVAFTDVIQNFTGTNTFQTGTNNNGRFMLQGNTGIDTSPFTGLGFQYYGSSGEGAIMSSYNDGYASLSFYTKQGTGYPVAKQVVIDRYGDVAIDQQANNAGVINNGTTNGAGLTFGSGSGEGIASQRTSGINADGLDFYTGFNHRLSILHNGNIGINNTNPVFQLDVAGTVSATNFSGSGAGLTNLNISLAELPSALGLISDPGNGNFFEGVGAGNPTVSGADNVGAGSYSLEDITSGSFNTDDGYGAGEFDTTGSYNSGFGALALQWVTTGSYNTASGVYALSAEPTYLTGSGNTADGAEALYSLGTGSNNVGIGYQTLYSAASDNGAVAVGYQALEKDATTGGFLTIGSGNVAVGYQALQQSTSGADNTALGYQALNKTTNGYNNTAVGIWALLQDTSGYGNTADGAYSLLADTTGYQNTASGTAAMEDNTTGYYNVAVGAGALQSETQDAGIVAIGYGALQNDVTYGGFISIGSGNEAVGYEALQADNTGFFNTAIGYLSLYQTTTGYENIALGVLALGANVGGYQNTALGLDALGSLTGGNNNLALGLDGGSAYTASESGNIDIGSSGTAGENNITHLGSGQTDTYVAGIIHGNAGLNIDQSGTYGQNNGSVRTDALNFGTGPSGSGEGIASQRTSGPNQFDIVLFTGFNPRLTVLSDGNVGIGLTNPAALLEVGGNAVVDDNLSTATLTIRGGSDLAEPFKISNPEADAPEGAVVVIDAANPGRLKLSDRPYDQHVAGVISGANGIHPGIQMQQQGLLEGGRNVALTGRVYVQADTSNGPIFPGDMLTTSRLPGRAMRVTDHGRAEGAILGKAMSGLMKGKGMVLVLVTLQ